MLFELILLQKGCILLTLIHLIVDFLLKQVDLEVMLLSEHFLIKKSLLLSNEGMKFRLIYLFESDLTPDIIEGFVQHQKAVRVLVIEGLTCIRFVLLL